MDSRAALMMSFVMVALLMKGAAAAIHTVGLGTVNGWTVPSDKSAYSTWANKNTFYLNDQLQFGWSRTQNVANATKDEYANCAKTAKVLSSTSQILIDLKTSGPQYFICTIDDHCQSGQKLAINVTGGTNPTTTTTPQSPPPPPSSASALTVGTLFAIVSSTIVMALLSLDSRLNIVSKCLTDISSEIGLSSCPVGPFVLNTMSIMIISIVGLFRAAIFADD